MADIKAKDIAVAQSIASSDLILGSSIAGTTANVRVDTLGNHILKNINQSDIGNVSTISFLSDLKKRVTRRGIFNERIITESPNAYYKHPTPIVLSTPSILLIEYLWEYDKPVAVGLSPYQEIANTMHFFLFTSKDMISPKPYSSSHQPTFLRTIGYVPNGTYYIYTMTETATTGSRVTITKLLELY